MSWNYRVIRYEKGGYGLHEVYYDDVGRPRSMTVEPVGFGVDADESVDDLVWMLEQALRDARERPVLDEQAIIQADQPSSENAEREPQA